jgi:hypothetical protein
MTYRDRRYYHEGMVYLNPIDVPDCELEMTSFRPNPTERQLETLDSVWGDFFRKPDTPQTKEDKH